MSQAKKRRLVETAGEAYDHCHRCSVALTGDMTAVGLANNRWLCVRCARKHASDKIEVGIRS